MFLQAFVNKDIPKESKKMSRQTKVVDDQARRICDVGKEIWDMFHDGVKQCNVFNPLYVPPKSGQNISGVLLQIREGVFKTDTLRRMHDSAYLKAMRQDEFKGKKDLATVSARNLFIKKEIDKNLSKEDKFTTDWYPPFWLLFVYFGVPCGKSASSPFRPIPLQSNYNEQFIAINY